MTLLVIVGIAAVVGAGILLWGVVSPRQQWRALSGWTFRNPAANEPSDAAYGLRALGSLFSLGLLLFLAFSMGSAVFKANDDASRLQTCEADLLPEIRALGDSGESTPSDFQRLADEHGLMLDTREDYAFNPSNDEDRSLSYRRHTYTFYEETGGRRRSIAIAIVYDRMADGSQLGSTYKCLAD